MVVLVLLTVGIAAAKSQSQLQSIQSVCKKWKWKRKKWNSPTQVTPFPANPLLQAHVKEPGVLLHVPFPLQLLAVWFKHSLISISSLKFTFQFFFSCFFWLFGFFLPLTWRRDTNQCNSLHSQEIHWDSCRQRIPGCLNRWHKRYSYFQCILHYTRCNLFNKNKKEMGSN